MVLVIYGRIALQPAVIAPVHATAPPPPYPWLDPYPEKHIAERLNDYPGTVAEKLLEAVDFRPYQVN
jgi:hypothetical protein